MKWARAITICLLATSFNLHRLALDGPESFESKTEHLAREQMRSSVWCNKLSPCRCPIDMQQWNPLFPPSLHKLICPRGNW